MTIIIVISAHSNGSKEAVAAFIDSEKAKEFGLVSEIGEARYDFYEAPPSAQPPARLFAAHRSVGKQVYELAGYYLNQFDAFDAAGPNGSVRMLSVEGVDAGEAETTAPDRAEKRRKHPAPPRRTYASPVPPSVAEASWFGRLCAALGGLKYVITLLVLGAVSIVINFIIVGKPPQEAFAQNASAVDWLPPSASDISYFKNDRFYVYEFTTTEAGFFEWAEQNELLVETIGGVPLEMETYRLYSPIVFDGMGKMSEEERWDYWEEISYVFIHSGYAIKGVKTDRSLKVSGGYDADKQMAYYWQRF